MAAEQHNTANQHDSQPAGDPLARAAETVAEAIRMLGEASDAHGWRARSFAGALRTLSTVDDVEPRDLAALAEALEEHVQGLAAAVNGAHALLSGRARA